MMLQKPQVTVIASDELSRSAGDDSLFLQIWTNSTCDYWHGLWPLYNRIWRLHLLESEISHTWV